MFNKSYDTFTFGKTAEGKETFYIFNTEEAENDQTCERHQICGKSVYINDVLLLRHSFIDDNIQTLVAFKMEDGETTCKVGYVTEEHIGTEGIIYFKNKLIQATHVDSDISSNKCITYKGIIKGIVIGKSY